MTLMNSWGNDSSGFVTRYDITQVVTDKCFDDIIGSSVWIFGQLVVKGDSHRHSKLLGLPDLSQHV